VSARRELPRGFELIRDGRAEMEVRADVRAPVLRLLQQWAANTTPAASRSLAGGRGGIAAFDLAPSLAVVLRPCLRGGWVGRFNRDLYLGFEPRPFGELAVAETIRARGVPTVEVLGAAVNWQWPGCYRGAVVSREIPQAVNLWQYLNSIDAGGRVRICALAAQVTRRLHDAGAIHPDLNLQNYLVRRGTAGAEVMIIDYDGVRLRPASDHDRQAAFARLLRSVHRLDPSSRIVTGECLEALETIAVAAGA
jgi:hypothetical protein